MSTVLWLAGVAWDDVPGTDRRLVEALAGDVEVIWVDPPRRTAWTAFGQRARPVPGSPRVFRVRTAAPPWAWRPAVRAATAGLYALKVAQATRGRKIAAIVSASPVIAIPTLPGAVRILYATDDWPAGAALMRLDRRWIERVLAHNVATADIVAAVSPRLLDRVIGQSGAQALALVLPNGAPTVPIVERVREPVAGIVGQINERLDLDYVEAVVDGGIPIRIIGPRFDRDPEFGRRFDALIGREGVEWTGPVPWHELPAQFARLSVGLTPYAMTEFNRASFPLKTLEYLAAGLPVVSTNIEASTWLDTALVTVCRNPAEYVAAVRADIAAGGDRGREAARRQFAAAHSWLARARTLLGLVEQAGAGDPVSFGAPGSHA